jgi:hypothetical protein
MRKAAMYFARGRSTNDCALSNCRAADDTDGSCTAIRQTQCAREHVERDRHARGLINTRREDAM